MGASDRQISAKYRFLSQIYPLYTPQMGILRFRKVWSFLRLSKTNIPPPDFKYEKIDQKSNFSKRPIKHVLGSNLAPETDLSTQKIPKPHPEVHMTFMKNRLISAYLVEIGFLWFRELSKPYHSFEFFIPIQYLALYDPDLALDKISKKFEHFTSVVWSPRNHVFGNSRVLA